MLIGEMQSIIESKVNEFSRTALIDKLVLSNVAIQEIRDPNGLNEKGVLNNGKIKMKYYTKMVKSLPVLILTMIFSEN